MLGVSWPGDNQKRKDRSYVMHKKKILVALIGGTAFGANLEHERHLDVDIIGKAIAPPRYVTYSLLGRMPHGNEPESPSAPVPGQFMEMATTSSATAVGTPVLNYLGRYKST